MDYQVAQKLHACTEPHTTDHPNDRVRDVVDLLLLKSAFYDDRADLPALEKACRDLFYTREREAEQAEETLPRSWPPMIATHPHWEAEYQTYSTEVGSELTLDQAVSALNRWIEEIDAK